MQGVEYLRPSLIFVSIYLILRADQTHRCDCSCAENQMCLKAQLNQDEGAQLLLARGLKVLNTGQGGTPGKMGGFLLIS